jgi:uncharacterized protein DUF3788
MAMVEGAFRERDRKPRPDEMAGALGERRPLWEALTDVLEVTLGATADVRWGGPNHGWELRYERGGRPLTTLTPLHDGLLALVVVGRNSNEVLPDLDLAANARGVVERSTLYPEGRWLYVPVESDRDLRDIYALLALKLPKTRRAALETHVGSLLPVAHG